MRKECAHCGEDAAEYDSDDQIDACMSVNGGVRSTQCINEQIHENPDAKRI